MSQEDGLGRQATRPRLRERLERGETLLGFAVTLPSAGILEIAGPRWGWFWIDGQHGQIAYADILEMVRTADGMGVPSIVRVPGHDYSVIGPVLDAGASGVMVPMVESVEHARAIVNATRFPPLGQRSFGGRRVVDLDGLGYLERANREVLVLAQIESATGLENCEKIAAVPGVDVLFLGPSDLRISMGLDLSTPMDDPTYSAAIDRVVAACKAEGKFASTVGLAIEAVEDFHRRGYQLLACGHDARILQAGIADAFETGSRLCGLAGAS